MGDDQAFASSSNRSADRALRCTSRRDSCRATGLVEATRRPCRGSRHIPRRSDRPGRTRPESTCVSPNATDNCVSNATFALRMQAKPAPPVLAFMKRVAPRGTSSDVNHRQTIGGSTFRNPFRAIRCMRTGWTTSRSRKPTRHSPFQGETTLGYSPTAKKHLLFFAPKSVNCVPEGFIPSTVRRSSTPSSSLSAARCQERHLRRDQRHVLEGIPTARSGAPVRAIVQFNHQSRHQRSGVGQGEVAVHPGALRRPVTTRRN